MCAVNLAAWHIEEIGARSSAPRALWDPICSHAPHSYDVLMPSTSCTIALYPYTMHIPYSHSYSSLRSEAPTMGYSTYE